MKTNSDDPLGLNSVTEQPPEFAVNKLSAEVRVRIEAEDRRARYRKGVRWFLWTTLGIALGSLFGWLIMR
jgi:hypothetical protein